MYVIMAFRYITYCNVLIKHLSYNMSSEHSGDRVPSTDLFQAVKIKFVHRL